MTPEERAYRNAWVAELWKPVPEWHPDGPIPQPVDKPGRRLCPSCGIAYSAEYLRHHLRRMHPAVDVAAVSGGAA